MPSPASGRTALLALLLLLSPAACEPPSSEAPHADAREEAVRPAPEPGGSAASEGPEPRDAPAARHRAMGTGEPVEPRPYTLSQRFLHAVRKGDRAAVERALELGASVDATDDLGRSALLLAVRDAGSLELARLLHERGADVDEPDKSGRTPLSFAAAGGRLDLVEWLLEAGAAADRPDRQARTPLFHAVARDRPEVVQRLLEAGADVDVQDQFGDTPLMVACAKGQGDMARLLRERGADPAIRDQEGRTARERAAPGTAACSSPGAPAAPAS